MGLGGTTNGQYNRTSQSGYPEPRYQQVRRQKNFKARLIARGFQQCPGVDFDETFSPIANWVTIQNVTALAARKEWKLTHLDVNAAYLNITITEEVYMTQLQGFEESGREHLVCR